MTTFRHAHLGVFKGIASLPITESPVLCSYGSQFAEKRSKPMENMALSCVDSGLMVLFATNGMGLANFSPRVEEQIATLHSHAYPVRINRLVFINACWIIRFRFRVRLFLSKKVWERRTFCSNWSVFCKNRHPNTVMSCLYNGMASSHQTTWYVHLIVNFESALTWLPNSSWTQTRRIRRPPSREGFSIMNFYTLFDRTICDAQHDFFSS